MQVIEIRPRTDADLPAAVDALHAVHLADHYPGAWPAEPAAWLAPPDEVRAWVAELDGAVVGGVALVPGATHTQLAEAVGVAADRLLVLSRLFVAPVGRGHGLARRLVGAAVDEARSRGLRVALDVKEESSAAIALYESLGWTPHGTGVATWRTQDGRHPAIRFYLAPEA